MSQAHAPDASQRGSATVEIRSLCVYASSSDRVAERYRTAAEALGTAIGSRGWTLVYGGARIGLMGTVAVATKAAGGRVVGVIPEHIAEHGLAFDRADELVVTSTLRERKAEMEQRADGFVALPGGFGTLEELLEIITLKQLHQHDKPICLLDIDGFYQPLIEVFEHLYRERFTAEPSRELYACCPDVSTLVDYLSRYCPPELGEKWE